MNNSVVTFDQGAYISLFSSFNLCLVYVYILKKFQSIFAY